MHYMGVDHHRQYSQMAVLDEEGRLVRTARVANLRREIKPFLDGLDEIRAVIETGRATYAMVDLLEDLGVEMTIANPTQVRAIAQAKIKTDKRDARILADLLRAGLIPAVYQRSRTNRDRQQVLRQRMFYVRMQTMIRNRVSALMARQDESVQMKIGCLKDLFTRKSREVLRGLRLAEPDRSLLDGLLQTHDHLTEKIGESNVMVRGLYREMDEAKRVSTVPGFGVFFSVLVTTEIADIKRFAGPGKLHAYAGLVPSTHASGERMYHGKIIRAGNPWLRWAAIEAAWTAIKHDFDLQLRFERMARRKTRSSAAVATARRLLTIIYKILKENRTFIPYLRNESAAFKHS